MFNKLKMTSIPMFAILALSACGSDESNNNAAPLPNIEIDVPDLGFSKIIIEKPAHHGMVYTQPFQMTVTGIISESGKRLPITSVANFGTHPLDVLNIGINGLVTPLKAGTVSVKAAAFGLESEVQSFTVPQPPLCGQQYGEAYKNAFNNNDKTIAATPCVKVATGTATALFSSAPNVAFMTNITGLTLDASGLTKTAYNGVVTEFDTQFTTFMMQGDSTTPTSMILYCSRLDGLAGKKWKLPKLADLKAFDQAQNFAVSDLGWPVSKPYYTQDANANGKQIYYSLAGDQAESEATGNGDQVYVTCISQDQ